MKTLDVREELVEAIEEKGEDVTQFANKAIELALRPRRAHALLASIECCCFTDEHCDPNP